MIKIKGIVLNIEKLTISRSKKGLPETKRVDFIMIPDNSYKPCRFQVRQKSLEQIKNIEVKDYVEVTFSLEMNEVVRDGQTRRFDNNVLEGVNKL